MMLKDKDAVIYGGGGAIGGAVARAFASEGPRSFSPGASRHPLNWSLRTSFPPGGSAEGAEVDAVNEQAVDAHLQSVIDKAGRVDLSFNAVGIPNRKIVGVPPAELDVEQCSLPITTCVTSYFLTARLAARHMIPNESGVIMVVTALHSGTGIPSVGATVRRRPPRRHSPETCPPSSRLTAFAWPVCDHRACRRHARSRTPTSPAPRHRDLPGNSGKRFSQARPTSSGS